MRWIRLGLLFLTAASAAHAGVNSWSPIGPYGGIATGIAIDPSSPATVYASSTTALYKSTNSGATWSLLPQNFGTYSIRDVQIDSAHPTRLYVISLAGGVFRSTDGGTTFTRQSAVPTDANTDGPTGFAISADGNTLYYSTIGGLFFRSTDGGTSFTQAHALPTTAATAQQFAIDPSDSRIVYGAMGTQLIKTIDGGDSWTSLPLPKPPVAFVAETYANSLVLVPGTPNTIWIGASQVYSTTDDGTNWTPAPSALGNVAVYRDPGTPGALYAIPLHSGGTVMHYASGSWQSLSPEMPAVVNRIAFSPGNAQTVMAATASGIFRTTNVNSVQWTHADTGFTGAKVGAFATTAGRLYAGTLYGELGITADESPMQTTVVSANLTPQSLTQMSSLAVHAANPNLIVAGFQQAGYRYTTDGGASWHDGSSYLHDAVVDALAVDPSNDSVVFAATRNGTPTPIEPIQRSDDGGMTFSPIHSTLDSVNATRLAVDPQKSSRLFLSAEEYGGTNGFFRSVDSGVTWTNLLPGSFVWDFAFAPGNSSRIFAAVGNLMVTDNSGDTFTASTSLSNAAIGTTIAVATDPNYSTGVYALNVNYTGPPIAQIPEYFVMRSVDDGASWERIANSTIPNWSPTKIAVDEQFAGVIAVATADSGVHLFHISPDLSLAILGHSGTKPIGVPSSYDMKAQNLGPLAATVVQLKSTFPAGAQSVSASVPNGNCVVAATTVQCTIPYLKFNDSVTAHVTYTPPAAGNLAVQASVSAREDDPVANNNSATAAATATETVDLAVTGSATPSTMTRGASFSYSFQVQNAGPNNSSSTKLSIAAPNGVTVSSATPSTCSVSAGTVTCDLGPLAAQASVSVTVAATTTNSGTLRATATATHATSAVDTNANNDVANVDIVSNDPPPPTTSNSGGGGGGGGGSLSLDALFVLMLIALWSAHQRRIRAKLFARTVV